MMKDEKDLCGFFFLSFFLHYWFSVVKQAASVSQPVATTQHFL